MKSNLTKNFIISTKPIENALKIGNVYIKGDFYHSLNHYFFFRHFLFEKDKEDEEYFALYVHQPEIFINSLNGDFIIVDYDVDKGVITVISDRLGKESAYIWNKNNELLITNQFWKGIELIDPKYEDINWLASKEIIYHGTTAKLETTIKDYNMMPAATILIFDINEGYREYRKQYWQLHFQPDIHLTLDEAAEYINTCFDKSFLQLSQKYSEDVTFGIGLSGGLDSRLLAHYSKKYGLKLSTYCVGEKYVRFPLISNGYRSANLIAKKLGIDDFKFISYNAETYLQKAIEDVLYAPIKSSELAITNLEMAPDFDIMLNGEHGGVFFGEFQSEPLLNYNKNNVADYLLSLLSFPQQEEMIFSKTEKKEILANYTSYVNSLKSDDRREIFYRFFFERFAPVSKYGFFETNYNTKERYCIYLDHNFMDFYEKWDPQFTVNRLLQQRLFTKYFHELSNIQDESPDVPIARRSDQGLRAIVSKLYYAGRYKVFGNSLQRNIWLRRDIGFKKLLFKVISVNKAILKEQFPCINIELFHKENPRATATLVKMLIEIDIIMNCRDSDMVKWIKGRYNYEE
jgi:hypothetical protein